jgi:DNA-binding beta-propeller fold protein YncE
MDVGARVIPLSSGGVNGLDIDPQTGLVYAVSNSTAGAWCGVQGGARKDLLMVVDPVQGKETAAVSTERGPVWPLVDRAKGLVYVAASGDTRGMLGIHQVGTGAPSGVVPLSGLPHDLGLDPLSGLLVVSNTFDGSQRYISAVDTSTRTVVGDFQVTRYPHRIMMDTAKRLAYVISVESGTITVVDSKTGKPLSTIESGGGGTLWFSQSLRRFYVPSRSSGAADTIRALNADTGALDGVIGPFLANAGHQAWGIAVDEGRGLLYATLGDSNLVGVADARTLKPLGVFSAGSCVWGVKMDEARGAGYVTDATGALIAFSLDRVAAALGR